MAPRQKTRRILIALGGNAILKADDRRTAEEQLVRVRSTAKELVRMIEGGDKIVITHGNGPQVGDILLRNELSRATVPAMPLDFCGAESQGMIGYMLQQALEEELAALRLKTPVATVLTQVLVDASDPAFKKPTKPIGPFYTREEAQAVKRERGWKLVRESGKGFRRVVPSPLPKEILEARTIASLYRSGAIVIAAGGGGIPVVRAGDGRLRGVEAVIDKDRTAALLAATLKAEVLLILTDVDRVCVDYDKPSRRPLDRVDSVTVARYLREGQFAPGSMGPKVESAIRFLESGGSRAVITSLELAERALAGDAGTTITKRATVE